MKNIDGLKTPMGVFSISPRYIYIYIRIREEGRENSAEIGSTEISERNALTRDSFALDIITSDFPKRRRQPSGPRILLLLLFTTVVQ